MMQQILTKVITNLFNTDPALVQTVIDAIQKSGSNVPLIGVTNGADAQPGQVGEWVDFVQTTPYTTAANQSVTLTMGVLQPGDWDIWAAAQYSTPVVSGEIMLATQPTGFTGSLYSFVFTGTADDPAWTNVVSVADRALISVPALIAMTVNTNQVGAGTYAGTCTVWFKARRRR